MLASHVYDQGAFLNDVNSVAFITLFKEGGLFRMVLKENDFAQFNDLFLHSAALAGEDHVPPERERILFRNRFKEFVIYMHSKAWAADFEEIVHRFFVEID